MPHKIRTVVLLAAGGFALGLPLGFTVGPRSAVFAFGAYLAGVSAAVLGYREGPLRGTARCARAALRDAGHRALRDRSALPADDAVGPGWLDTIDFLSIGSGSNDTLRVFGTVNSPGTLARCSGWRCSAT